MTMSTTEQNTLNQALNTAKTGTQVAMQTDGGVNQYVLVRLVPLRMMSPAELTAFVAIYSVTVASP